jgi:hypothetical protein
MGSIGWSWLIAQMSVWNWEMRGEINDSVLHCSYWAPRKVNFSLGFNHYLGVELVWANVDCWGDSRHADYGIETHRGPRNRIIFHFLQYDRSPIWPLSKRSENYIGGSLI